MSLKSDWYLIKLRVNLNLMISDARGKFNWHFEVFTFKVNNYECLIFHSIYLISVYWMSDQITLWIHLEFSKIEQIWLNYSSQKINVSINAQCVWLKIHWGLKFIN